MTTTVKNYVSLVRFVRDNGSNLANTNGVFRPYLLDDSFADRLNNKVAAFVRSHYGFDDVDFYVSSDGLVFVLDRYTQVCLTDSNKVSVDTNAGSDYNDDYDCFEAVYNSVDLKDLRGGLKTFVDDLTL